MSLEDINACILVPTYNNGKTLARVLDGLLAFSGPGKVLVVNDGSTDNTEEIISKYGDEIIVLKNAINKGKGYSLRKGFKEAIARGFERAITIDSDGQHLPEDLPVFIEAALKNPDALLMGSRNMNQDGVPAGSSFGNRFSNFWFRFETGISLPDTQTGYRLYPLEPLRTMRLFTTKFETEIELIVKMTWRNIPIIPVSIQVIYDKNERVSHFRPFKDFARISLLNTYLVILTLLYYLPMRLWRETSNKGLWNIIKNEIAAPHQSNLVKALSIGFGLFMGIVPIWGFQLLIGIPLALFFRLNKILFLIAANISIPPMIPIIIYASYLVGGWFYSNDESVMNLSLTSLTLESIHLNFVQYFIGGICLAIMAGIAGFIISLPIFKFIVFRDSK